MKRFDSLVGKTYYVRTYGCQMNLHDSERVAGLLDSCGCLVVGTPDEADIVVYMTCCVRENADQKLYGQVSAMVSAPEPPSGRRIVAIGGCIGQRDGAALRKRVPNVDVVFGTSALAAVPELISQAIEHPRKEVYVDIDEVDRGFATDLPSHRERAYQAWVPIMTGCNNFCSYCIVPYVRGREMSRPFESVVAECEQLVGEGVREITLLGQNVNSYGRDRYGSPRFAELLRDVARTGVERLRFTSSNPKDLNQDVIRSMAESPAVMPHLHLAVQSGSSRILKLMNRSYDRKSYLGLVKRLREAMPGLALSTDIIVGFPGETEEDFEETMSLVEEVRYSSAYTFIYSRRPGTPAAEYQDDTPRDVIQARFERLAELVATQAHDFNQPFLGTLTEVLVEGASKRSELVCVGHSPHNQTVHFRVPDGMDPKSLEGSIVSVRVNEARTWYLSGEVEGLPR